MRAPRLTYVSPNAHLIFGHSSADIRKQGRVCFILPKDLFDPDLLEQRGEIIDVGIKRLTTAVRPDAAEAVCMAIMAGVGTDLPNDDIAVLTLRRIP